MDESTVQGMEHNPPEFPSKVEAASGSEPDADNVDLSKNGAVSTAMSTSHKEKNDEIQ